MNIFKILASGGVKLKEPNVSAFLGYLLDPKADHGLNSSFLQLFLQPLHHELEQLTYENSIKDLSSNLFDVEVAYEKGIDEYDYEEDEVGNNNRKGRTSVVDIIIKISKKPPKSRSLLSMFQNNNPVALILIENKINTGAFTAGQLAKQHKKTIDFLEDQLEKKEEEEFFKIFKENCFSIYVTPDEEKYDQEFQDFIATGKRGAHLKWKCEDNSSNDLVSILRTLIKKDEDGEIEPIQDYTKHTIKALINFVLSDFKSEQEEKKEGKGGKNFVPAEQFYKKLEEKRFYSSLKKIDQEIQTKENFAFIGYANGTKSISYYPITPKNPESPRGKIFHIIIHRENFEILYFNDKPKSAEDKPRSGGLTPGFGWIRLVDKLNKEENHITKYSKRRTCFYQHKSSCKKSFWLFKSRTFFERIF